MALKPGNLRVWRPNHMLQAMFYRRTLQCPDEYMPKLIHVARKVINDGRNAVVLIKERSSHRFFVKLLAHMRNEKHAQ